MNNCIDLKIENGDLASDEGLETAVLISLFTDQRVSEADLPGGEISRRGFWGDLLAEVEGDQEGSTLWTTDRSKQTLETEAAQETAITNALSWMIADGVAKRIEAEVSFDERGRNVAEIRIVRPDDEENRFKLIWDEQELKRA